MASSLDCPVCHAALSRCSGAYDMPASQEYWQCAHCGLSAHESRLLSAANRDELRHEHLVSLRRRAAEGKEAHRQLRAARYRTLGTEHTALAIAATGLAWASLSLVRRMIRRVLEKHLQGSPPASDT